jgi:hypothetical protein
MIPEYTHHISGVKAAEKLSEHEAGNFTERLIGALRVG